MIRQESDSVSKPVLPLVAAVVISVFASLPAVAVTLTFQEGINGYTGTADTFLAQNEPATAKGALSAAGWDSDDPPGTGLDAFLLIRFDNIFGNGVGQIPPGSQITSATLTYTVFNGGDVGLLHEVAIPWVESVTYNGFGGSPGVQPADYGVQVTNAPGTAQPQTVVFVTTSLAKWSLNPADNNGWIVLPTGNDGVDIRASEYIIGFQRPILTVVINEGPPVINLVRKPYLQKATPTSMTIVWRTDQTTDTQVHYGLSPSALNTTVSDPTLTQDHFITLNGLSPDTKYFYDVGTTTAVIAGGDANHYLVTPPTAGTIKKFTAWIVGDSGTGGADQAAVRDAMVNETGSNPPDIFIHVGDMAYNSGTDLQFTNNFFAPYRNILRHTVTWPTIGNHEAGSSNSSTQSGPYYEGYVLPTGGEAGGLATGTEAYYSFDHANVHFICLDSQGTPRTLGSAMLNWLTADLAATNQDWIIAFWHHPPYTKGTHDSDNVADSGGRMRDMRENVLPILEAGGVDLVLAGHSHIYERSFLVNGAYDTPTTAAGHIVDIGDGRIGSNGPYVKSPGLNANEGAVYIVAGHGGRGASGPANHVLMFFSETRFGSCLMTVNNNLLTVKNIRDDGVISDRFNMVKGSVTGDCDGDGDVDSNDFLTFSTCFNGSEKPPMPGCLSPGADIDLDGDVDLFDFMTFSNCYNGALNPPDCP